MFGWLVIALVVSSVLITVLRDKQKLLVVLSMWVLTWLTSVLVFAGVL